MEGMTQLEYLTAIAIRDNYRDVIEIKRNDPCPCGSGLKFKNCHKDSGDKWVKGFEFDDGNFLYENVSLTINLLETIKEILLKLKYCNSIDEEVGLELIEELYTVYDPAIRQLQKNAPCQKGCTACCFQDVALQKIEVQRISRYMDKQIKKNIKHNLKEKKVREEIPSSLWRDRKNSMEPCPFINITKGECSIYSVRPFKCKSHFVASSPSLCNEIEGKITRYDDDRYIMLMELVIALINKLVYDDIHPTLIRNFYQEISFKKRFFGITKDFTGKIMKGF
ncbi:SEC-C metal-binding domain-containing protein [Bacillus cereus group sp. MYBK95-2]|uniref:YkgJ family cysteine cluster protein n=1 Tax=Bacillus cereus group sp. MYBK95-2 TaxID=3450599 RepID=UPI003F7B3471